MSTDCCINTEVPLSLSFDPLTFLTAACNAKAIEAGAITVSFVSPEKIVALNQQYLKRDYVTDIISFNLSTPPEPILGDIYICVRQATQNAQEFGQSLENEIKLLIVHGVLHLLGYADYTKTEQIEMRNQETQLLNLIHHGHPTI